MKHHCDCHGNCHCSIFGVFLGFLTGLTWLLLSAFGTFNSLFALIGLGFFGCILTIIIGLIGFLAVFFFGLCIFKKVWRCWKWK